MSTLANYLGPQDICLDVVVTSKAELLDAIARHMQRVHSLSRESVFLNLSRREQVGSTGLGEGVAIPHARVSNLDQILAAYMRLKVPIPFDAKDGQPVFDILVLLVPKHAEEEHLRVLADASRLFSERRFREDLHQCANPHAVIQLLNAWNQAV